MSLVVGLRRLVQLCVLAACVFGTARAQDEQLESVDHSRATSHDRAILDSRNREQMHSALPVKISGLEQGGRDHLATTPALENSDHKATAVAQDELYRRTLAIYTNHANFHDPLPIDFAATQEVNDTPTRHLPRVAIESVAPPRVWPWVVGLALSAVVAIGLFRRFGPRAPMPSTMERRRTLRAS